MLSMVTRVCKNKDRDCMKKQEEPPQAMPRAGPSGRGRRGRGLSAVFVGHIYALRALSAGYFDHAGMAYNGSMDRHGAWIAWGYADGAAVHTPVLAYIHVEAEPGTSEGVNIVFIAGHCVCFVTQTCVLIILCLNPVPGSMGTVSGGSTVGRMCPVTHMSQRS